MAIKGVAMLKSNIFLFLLLQLQLIFCQGSIIILYGTSSSGKTSISRELGTILSGKWKVVGIDMFSNKTVSANSQMWKQVNKYISQDFNVVVDTVHTEFLTNTKQNANIFTVLTYCAPNILAQHVAKRNKENKKHDHRDLKKVLNQFYNKYRITDNKKSSIDTLYKTNIENSSDSTRTLKHFANDFFKKEYGPIVYIASQLYKYDFFINTGNYSINMCAQKIKDKFEAMQIEDTQVIK